MVEIHAVSDSSPDPSSRQTVLVTGATGFLGSHVVEALLAEGYAVRCTVRRTSNLRWIEALPVERVIADLRSPGDLEAVLHGASLVVHAAGVTRAASDAAYHRVNAEGTQHLAAAAVACGIERFVLVSSLAARGPDARAGRSEGGDRPSSAYGESKLAAERRLFQVVAQSSGPMQPVILRPGAVYGPRDEGSLHLFRLARAGVLPVPTSRGRLQPIFVRDVAEAVVRATARPDVEMGPYALAGPEIITWEQLAMALETAVGRKIRLVRLPTPAWQVSGAVSEAAARLFKQVPPFDRRTADDLARFDWTAVTDRAERELGWTPDTRVADAMALTARWYREHGWLGG